MHSYLQRVQKRHFAGSTRFATCLQVETTCEQVQQPMLYYYGCTNAQVAPARKQVANRVLPAK